VTARTLIRLTALSGAIAVIASAFGAHGATGKTAEWFKTGGEYELVHALAAIVAVRLGVRVAGWLMLGGSVLFAGTLYAMGLGGPLWLGAVTPLGGLAMIAGWLWLAWRAVELSEG
jgi:uncharacterized membrane protein YgdD (TMEM256/DUF423 family)